MTMTRTCRLSITPEVLTKDTITAALGEIEGALQNIRKYAGGRETHTEEVDVRDLLAESQAIGLIWEADMLVSTYPHLSRGQAWEVLQECERHYTAENGLSWDDVAEVVGELFPDPAERLKERAGRCHKALEAYTDYDPATNLIDFLTDARHWSDEYGQDFAALNGKAYDHYLAERSSKED